MNWRIRNRLYTEIAFRNLKFHTLCNYMDPISGIFLDLGISLRSVLNRSDIWNVFLLEIKVDGDVSVLDYLYAAETPITEAVILIIQQQEPGLLIARSNGNTVVTVLLISSL